MSASASGDWWGGSVALGVVTLDQGVERDQPESLLRDPASLLYLGPVGASTSVAALGYAREFMGLRWGVTAKYVSQRVGSSRATTAAADLGVAFDFGVGNVALSVQNLGQGLELAGTTLDLAQRTLVTLGTLRRPTGPIDLGVNAHIGRDGSGEVLAGGGLEVAYWPIQGRTFIARIGASNPGETSASPLTFGGGFAGDQFQVDYSYGGFDSVDAAHRFSVSIR